MRRRRFLQTGAVLALPLEGALSTPREAWVETWNNKPSLHIGGKPVYASFYALTDATGGRWSFDELPRQHLRQFADAGFRLFQVDVFLEDLWPREDAFDITPARRQIAGVLSACGEASVVLRWHLNAPRWWAERHREECVVYANGPLERVERNQPVRYLMDDLRRTLRVSLASETWKEMATGKTIELLRGLAGCEEGKALAGVHLACGVYGEWHYWGFMRNEPDLSEPMQRHFREWRRLRGKPPLPVPGMAEREALDDGIFRDPARREGTIDYYRCQQELVAGRIIHFCGTVKRHWPRRILTGTFYGYFFSLFDRQATGGHLCLDKVLAAKDVDYLSAPQAYGAAYRDMGGCGITRGLVETVRLHGKLWLDEMDQTPSWSWRNDVDTAFQLTDLPADFAILRRNVVESYVRGAGLWYYDFGPANGSGWWADRRLLAEIRRIKDVLERYHARPYSPAGDVLLVFDTEVYFYTATMPAADPMTDSWAVNRTAGAAYQSGAAVETIHLRDLERVALERFRVVVFANTWLLRAGERRMIREKVMAGGRHVVFQGLPGYCDGERLDAAFSREATGLPLERGEGSFDLGGGKRFSPYLRLAGKGRERVWFSSAPIADPARWREIFRAAGAHVYADGDCVVHAGGGVVLVHTKAGGERVITLRNGVRVEAAMEPRSSWLLDAETGKRLL